MRRGNLFHGAALLSLMALFMAAIGMSLIHPWLHAHNDCALAGAPDGPAWGALALHTHHGDCAACAFLAGFHAPTHEQGTCVSATSWLGEPLPLPASTAVLPIPCLPLGARAPPL
jgi:hypothetical protein